MLNKLASECFEIAKSKGFNCYTKENEDLVVPRDLMLVVSEIGEACEALRIGKRANYEYFRERIVLLNGFESAAGKQSLENNIKDTYEDEIADAIIRLLHLSAMMNIDIEQFVKWKLEYNKTRPVMHGGKKF